MNFKQEFFSALQSGKSYEELLELVRCREQQGLNPREAYELLQEIWLELGFDWKEEGGMQDTLEAVMEKAWYGCPASG